MSYCSKCGMKLDDGGGASAPDAALPYLLLWRLKHRHRKQNGLKQESGNGKLHRPFTKLPYRRNLHLCIWLLRHLYKEKSSHLQVAVTRPFRQEDLSESFC